MLTFNAPDLKKFRHDLVNTRHWCRMPMRLVDESEVFGVLEEHHKENFTQQKGPWGRWRRLSEITVIRRMARHRISGIPPFDYAGWPSAAVGQFEKVLHWTGRLRSSLTGESYGHSAPGDQVRALSDTRLIFGTRVPYAEIHQYGGQSSISGSTVAFGAGRSEAPEFAGVDASIRFGERGVRQTITVPPRAFLDDLYAPPKALNVIERNILAWITGSIGS